MGERDSGHGQPQGGDPVKAFGIAAAPIHGAQELRRGKMDGGSQRETGGQHQSRGSREGGEDGCGLHGDLPSQKFQHRSKLRFSARAILLSVTMVTCERAGRKTGSGCVQGRAN